MMIRIGMDLGTSAIKTIVLEDGGAKRYANSERHHGDISGALSRALAGVKEHVGGEAASFALTGSQAKLFEGLSSCFIHEIPATVEGAVPETR
jgi:activator of 2-hydroxyglutaryl-CoA dehydratase